MTVLKVYPTGLTRPDGSPVQSKYASSLSASGKRMERSITQEEALLDSLSPSPDPLLAMESVGSGCRIRKLESM
jgi:hypothetical protein